jgi:hypothetical protein
LDFCDVRLDGLKEARDHLLIRISIMVAAGDREVELNAARAELGQVDEQIRYHRPKAS